MAAPLNQSVICPVLIGRASFLESLHQLIDQAARAAGRVVLVSGEAGVGKSRLIAGAKAHAVAQGFLTLQGNCFEPDHILPYAPLLDLLSTFSATPHATEILRDLGPAAQELVKLPPELAPLIPDLAPTPPPDLTDRPHGMVSTPRASITRQAIWSPAPSGGQRVAHGSASRAVVPRLLLGAQGDPARDGYHEPHLDGVVDALYVHRESGYMRLDRGKSGGSPAHYRRMAVIVKVRLVCGRPITNAAYFQKLATC